MMYMDGVDIVCSPYDADIFFFNKKTHFNLGELQDRGVKIVLDIDDYWQLPKEHFYYRNWIRNNVTSRIMFAMGIADAVITTTELLAAEIRPINKNVHVIPNALPYGDGQFNMQQAEWTGRALFVGGKSHVWDMPLLPESYRYIPGRLPVDRYMRHYEDVNIALAPLIDNHFNSFKSNLKILEAGAAYAACLCSPVDAFMGAPVTYVGEDEWPEAIEQAMLSPEYSQRAGRLLNEWCREHFDLRKVNIKRKKVLESL